MLLTGAKTKDKATQRATVMNAKPTTGRVRAVATLRVIRRCTTGHHCRWAPGVATATRSLAKRSWRRPSQAIQVATAPRTRAAPRAPCAGNVAARPPPASCPPTCESKWSPSTPLDWEATSFLPPPLRSWNCKWPQRPLRPLLATTRKWSPLFGMRVPSKLPTRVAVSPQQMVRKVQYNFSDW